MKTDPDKRGKEILKNTKDVNIATASSRMAKKWKNQSTTIEDFVNKLSTTIITQETVEEYSQLPKNEQDQIKDVGAFVGGTLKGGRRRKSDVANRSIITLDLDYATPKTMEIIKKEIKFAFTLYSTHKHTPKRPRLRLLIWPNRIMLPDEYQAVSRRLANKIGIEWFDDTSYDTNRLFYWPSTSSNAEFLFYHNDAPFLPVDKVLAAYGDEGTWKDGSKWPRSSRETKSFDRLLKKQADPLSKKGIVGAFSRVVSIREALDEYLVDVYKKESKDRYSYIEGSSTNGLVIYSDKWAFSNHDSDPASGQLCNAFDLIRIQKFYHLDDKAKPDTPTTKLPSYIEMDGWARKIDGVKSDLVKSGIEIDAAAFDEFDYIQTEEWEAKLQTNEAGLIKPTFVNAVKIIKNDLEIKDRTRFNEFSLKMERETGENWGDEDSLRIRNYVGNKYQVDFPERKIEQAIENNAYRNKYHPVRNYLEDLKWDKVERIETVFIDYFGCEDNIYTREVALCWFSAAVHRIFEPGFKFDTSLVISGAQGIGKTMFIRELGLIKWYGELSSFDPKIAMEEITGKWIIEISEMGATNKRELEEQKSFLSACHTRVRMAYAHHAVDFKRQSVFIGSTNQREYLKDSTGNRRWWPLDATAEAVNIKKLKKEVNQLWAEAYMLWIQTKSVFLSKPSQEIAKEVQEGKREPDEWKGIIESWLNEEGYSDRYATKLGSMEGATEYRDKVCVVEIWEDCLNQINRSPRPADRRRITGIMDNIEGWERVSTIRFGKRFGRQRGWKTNVPF